MSGRPAKRQRSASPDGAGPSRSMPRTSRANPSEKAKGQAGPAVQPIMEQLTKPEWFTRYRLKDLKQGEVFYKPDWVDAKTANAWLKGLDSLSEWYRPTLKVYGREIVQSRDIAAFSTSPDLTLKYSGTNVEMHSPFPPLLQEIADRLSSEECLGKEVGFNHCMLNRYSSGDIHIGKHSDNLENKVIVTVSLGAPRTFILERKKPRGSSAKAKKAPQPAGLKVTDDTDGERKKIVLANGSLLVMQGDTQKNYTHEIPKERKVKEPRISITFRQLIY